MKTKPKIGQKVYSLNAGYGAGAGREKKLTEFVVKKVGRKYFTAGIKDETWKDSQYFIAGWRQKTDYSVTSTLYESPQAWEDEKEARAICRKFQKHLIASETD